MENYFKDSYINYNKTKYYSEPTIPISDSLLYTKPSLIINILTSVLSWSINGQNVKKITDFLIVVQFLFIFPFIFKKSVIVHSWILSLIPIHFLIIIEQYWDVQTWKSLVYMAFILVFTIPSNSLIIKSIDIYNQ